MSGTNVTNQDIDGNSKTSHNRLSAFGASGTKELLEDAVANNMVTIAFRLLGRVERQIGCHKIPMQNMSQSPFGFWGEWTLLGGVIRDNKSTSSQSPFGFWGEWTSEVGQGYCRLDVVTIAFRLLG